MEQAVRARRARRMSGAVVGAVLVLAAGTVQAGPPYEARVIARAGDTVGSFTLKKSGNAFSIGGLNDQGHLLFSTFTEEAPRGVALFQFADSQFTPIIVAGGDGPLGKWPADVLVYEPAGMNQDGDVVFAPTRWNQGSSAAIGTFLWDRETRTVLPLIRGGMPAVQEMTFQDGGDFSAVINNRGEIAFPATLKEKHGSFGIFFRGADGGLQPVVLPGQPLPEGGQCAFTWRPSLNDAGVVAFLANAGGGNESAYRWEKEVITPLLRVGASLPDGKKVARVRGVWLNNQNGRALIAAQVGSAGTGPCGLYLVGEGDPKAVARPGQDMPGGGKLKSIPMASYGVSRANELGEHAFIATLEEGSTAAYLMKADGGLSLILKADENPGIGMVTRIGETTVSEFGPLKGGVGIALNRQGQVALTVTVADGPLTMVMLTPAVP